MEVTRDTRQAAGEGAGRAEARPEDDARHAASDARHVVGGAARRATRDMSHAACRVSSPDGASRPMKPSGIPWLGDVPEEWGTSRVGYLLIEFNRRSEDGNGEPLSMSQKLGIVPSKEIEVANPASSFVGAKIVSAGDLVLNKLKAHLGVFAISKHDGLVSPDYAVYHARDNASVEYLNYVFHTPPCISEFRRRITGVAVGFNRLYTSDLFKVVVPFPPLPEQRLIARFLDGVGARIDGLKAKMASEIERLEAYKRSFIAEAVAGRWSAGNDTRRAAGDTRDGRATRDTRKSHAEMSPRLSHDACRVSSPGGASRPMKPSGIPWLGDVPEEWVVTRIGYVATRKLPEYAPEEELLSVFLDRGVIRFVEGGSTRANVTSTDLSKYQLVEIGDFVLNNQQAWRGSVGVSAYRGIISPAYLILRLREGIDVNYANYLFRSKLLVALYEQCSHGVGSIQRNIYWEELRVQKIAFPPLSEQREIAAMIDRRIATIDAVIAKRKAERERLDALKKSIICEAVTGRKEIQQ